MGLFGKFEDAPKHYKELISVAKVKLNLDIPETSGSLRLTQRDEVLKPIRPNIPAQQPTVPVCCWAGCFLCGTITIPLDQVTDLINLVPCDKRRTTRPLRG